MHRVHLGGTTNNNAHAQESRLHITQRLSVLEWICLFRTNLIIPILFLIRRIYLHYLFTPRTKAKNTLRNSCTFPDAAPRPISLNSRLGPTFPAVPKTNKSGLRNIRVLCTIPENSNLKQRSQLSIDRQTTIAEKH